MAINKETRISKTNILMSFWVAARSLRAGGKPSRAAGRPLEPKYE